MPEKLRNQVLIVLMYLLVASSVWTLLPFASSRSNDLGYVSACPFAPWSTLFLLLLAVAARIMRQYFLTRPPPPRLGS